MMKLNLTVLSNYTVERTIFEGLPHIIVPVTLLTVGVHSGSGGPVLYLEEEISKFPAAWNGEPVPIYHPTTEDGSPVSCNSPEIIEAQTYGRLFNVFYGDGKLKGEIWLNENKLRMHEPQLLARILSGDSIEVSTGLWSDDEIIQGIWQNEQYNGIVRNIRPDHLAILPDQIGACSLADGCGIRANVLQYTQEGGIKMYLNAKSKKRKCADKKNAMLPIDNEVEIRASWSFINSPLANGIYDDDSIELIKNRIMAEWQKKIKTEGPTDNETVEGLSKVIFNELSLMSTVEKIRQTVDSWDIRDSEGNMSKVNFLQDIYEGYFVYRVRDYTKTNEVDKMYKRSYTVDGSGNVEINTDAVEVQQEVSYTPISATTNSSVKQRTRTTPHAQKEEQPMSTEVKKCCPDKVKALIGNGHFTEADSTWLGDLSPEAFAAIESAVVKANVTETKVADPTPAQEPIKDIPTFNSLLSQADPDTRDAINEGIRIGRERKSALIATIMTNKANTFQQCELESKPIDELVKINALIPETGVVDYSLKGPSNSSMKDNESSGPVLDVPSLSFKKEDV